MNNRSPSLQCSVSIQSISVTNVSGKAEVSRNAEVLLGRDFVDIPVLRVHTGKCCKDYPIDNVQIHRRFLKDGKATLQFTRENTQVLISNCPPHNLLNFLKLLVAKKAKHRVMKNNNPVTVRERLFNHANQAVFTEVSPLCETDLTYINRSAAALPGQTPKGKAAEQNSTRVCKRKLEHDKENIPPDGYQSQPMCKQTKRTISLTSSLSEFTADQIKVLNVIMSGRNVFFTGSAGTGKSYLLQRVIGSLAPEHTFVTASTGIAAAHISGMTLHSFAGIGSGTAELSRCIELANRKVVAAQWRKCRHLIIDEISMVDGEFFSKLEAVARVVRKSTEPFGGIQLIICGDFLQLPPVRKSKENPDKQKLAFETNAWRKSIQQTILLRDVKRQTDSEFISILQRIRKGVCDDETLLTLRLTCNNQFSDSDIIPTKLSTHNEHVDRINRQSLEELEGESRFYKAVDNDTNMTSRIDELCPAASIIELKKGAQVMIVKNLSVKDDLVNGSRGVVIRFSSGADKCPVIRLLNGKEKTIQPELFKFKWSGGITLTRRQLPLRLAWAVSIHKSQGMTLDLVEMSLSRVFECGQAYVALSRARSLSGLRVLDFSADSFKVDEKVLQYYERLEKRLM